MRPIIRLRWIVTVALLLVVAPSMACTLGHWSSVENNAGILAAIEDSSHFTESCGLRVSLDGNNSAYLEDQTPGTLEPLVDEYSAQFDLFIAASEFATGDYLEIFSMQDYNGLDIASLGLIKQENTIRLRLKIKDEAGFQRRTTSQNTVLENGWHHIRLSWKASEVLPATNGKFIVSVDNGAAECSSAISGVGNPYQRISSVRLGAISGNVESITGSIDFDEFDSNRNLISLSEPCDSPLIGLPENRWQQIALPGTPAVSNSIADLFGDDLDIEAYGQEWVIYFFDSQQNKYVDPGINADLKQGIGYWIIQMTGHDVQVDIDNYVHQPDGYITNLFENGATGWNMVGLSKAVGSSWDQYKVISNTGSCAGESGCSVIEAAAENILHDKAWHYNGQEYLTLGGSANVPAWAGFWCATLPGAQGESPRLFHPEL